MTITYLAANWISGLSTDTKPSTANTPNGTIFFETDTFARYELISGTWTNELTFAQTFQNKTMDALSNTFSNLAISPFATNAKRMGIMTPAATAAGSLDGALGGWPTGGTFSTVNDATNGTVNNFNSSSSGAVIGYLSNSTSQVLTQRTWNPVLKAKILVDTTSNSRLYIGFSSNNTLPATDTPLGSSEHGVICGFRTTDTNFSVFNNDGTAAEVVTSFGVAKDTSWHTFSITMSSGNVVAVLDDGAGAKTQTITTRMPGSTTTIYANCVMELNAASAMNIKQDGIYFVSDK